MPLRIRAALAGLLPAAPTACCQPPWAEIGLGLVLFALTVPLAAQDQGPPQKPPEQRRLIYIPLGTRPAKPLAPEPGDEFSVDSVRREIVIGRSNAAGVLTHHRVPLLTNVDPQITSEIEAQGDSVRYTYGLTNGTAAKQAIELLAIGSHKPELLTDVETPPSFRASVPSLASWGTPPRYNWHARYLEELPPGKSAGPFGFTAPLLPGLERAYVSSRQGLEPLLDRSAVTLSPWLSQKLEEAWKLENNTVQPWVIGPKIDIPAPGQAAQLIGAIRQEFVEAASLPEFASERARLTALAERLSGAAPETAAVESAIKDAGTTPLQRAFYEAMSVNLAWLRRL